MAEGYRIYHLSRGTPVAAHQNERGGPHSRACPSKRQQVEATCRASPSKANRGAGSVRQEVSVAKEDRGFASMDRTKQREIASKGGRAAHQKGTAHEWTSEEAREAGRKGGMASHRRRTELTGNQGTSESAQNLESSDMSRRDDESQGEQIRCALVFPRGTSSSGGGVRCARPLLLCTISFFQPRHARL